MTGVEEVRIRANGISFRALAAGPAGAPSILLLHGWPDGAESWLPQLRALAGAGRRAIAPDLRGYGGTDAPEDPAEYAMPVLVADVGELIRVTGAEHLAGHDWGGIIGWTAVARSPELVRTWTSLAVPHLGALASVMRTDADQQRRLEYIRLLRMPGKAEAVLAESGFQRLRAVYSGGDGNPALAAPIADRFVAGFARPGRLTATLNYYRSALGRGGVAGYEEAEPIRTPSMLVWGDRDPAMGRRAVEASAARMGGPFRLEILEGAGHWLQHERPDDVSRLLIEHMAVALT